MVALSEVLPHTSPLVLACSRLWDRSRLPLFSLVSAPSAGGWFQGDHESLQECIVTGSERNRFLWLWSPVRRLTGDKEPEICVGAAGSFPHFTSSSGLTELWTSGLLSNLVWFWVVVGDNGITHRWFPVNLSWELLLPSPSLPGLSILYLLVRVCVIVHYGSVYHSLRGGLRGVCDCRLCCLHDLKSHPSLEHKIESDLQVAKGIQEFRFTELDAARKR